MSYERGNFGAVELPNGLFVPAGSSAATFDQGTVRAASALNDGFTGAVSGDLLVKNAQSRNVLIGTQGASTQVPAVTISGTDATVNGHLYATSVVGVAGSANRATVTTGDTTTSTSYVDLPSAGPAVTVAMVSGQYALVLVQANFFTSDTTLGHFGYASYAASGAYTLAASDNNAATIRFANSNRDVGITKPDLMGPATSTGNVTVTMKYRTSVSTQAAGFLQRRLIVIPL